MGLKEFRCMVLYFWFGNIFKHGIREKLKRFEVVVKREKSKVSKAPVTLKAAVYLPTRHSYWPGRLVSDANLQYAIMQAKAQDILRPTNSKAFYLDFSLCSG
jgi:hypothetical protein